MSTHDYVIANQTGANTRSDLNNAFSAIVSNNSSASEPATMYAYQWWADTANDLLKQRNAANSAWISILTLSTGKIATGAEVVDDTTPQLGGDLDCNGAQIQWSKGADVASATALPVLTDGNYFDVTGTTTVTSINATGGAGTLIKLHFDAILILTHHATDLILPGGANITTAAGDEAEFVEYASGDYRCTSYTKADGRALIAPTNNAITSTAQAFTEDQTFEAITETKTTKSASFTPDLSNDGTLYSCSGTMTITMPSAESGKSFTIIHATATSITWAGTIKWNGGSAPTAGAGIDIYVFVSDGTNWYGMQSGTGFA